MRRLVEQLRDQHDISDEEFANVINLDVEDVWRRLDAEAGDLSELIDVAVKTAEVDGTVHKLESAVIEELRERYGLRQS